MFWIAVCLIAGSLMLYFASDWLVTGAKGLAHRLGVSPFVIGLTIVAFGSSAPECITSIVSTSNPSLIIGNVVGSNIANVGLAIGLAALAGPMAAKYESMRVEMIAMLVASVGLCALSFIGDIGRFAGIGMIILLFVFLYVVFTRKKSDESGREMYESDAGETPVSDRHGTPFLIVMTVVGLVLLYFGAKYFIAGAKDLAEMMGVSDLVIGLIVVAIGTSLPEICISFMAARKGEADLAVANIVGSNIFNILFVLGVGAVLVDIPISESLLVFHLSVMLLFSAAMFAIVRTRGKIERPSGALLVAMYAVYVAVMAMVPDLMLRSLLPGLGLPDALDGDLHLRDELVVQRIHQEGGLLLLDGDDHVLRVRAVHGGLDELGALVLRELQPLLEGLQVEPPEPGVDGARRVRTVGPRGGLEHVVCLPLVVVAV